MLQRWHQANGGRPAIAGLLLLLFVAPVCLSSFDALHHALHDHSDEPDHQCAVVLLQQGLVDAADPTVLALTPAAVPIDNVCLQDSFTSSTVALLPPGRAPPEKS